MLKMIPADANGLHAGTKSVARKCLCDEKRQVRLRAGDGIRTHDNNVGNVVLYQLSYARKFARIPAYRKYIGIPIDREDTLPPGISADYMVSPIRCKR